AWATAGGAAGGGGAGMRPRGGAGSGAPLQHHPHAAGGGRAADAPGRRQGAGLDALGPDPRLGRRPVPSLGSRLINARSETAATKPSFRSAFRSRRCLVVADGFYEWQKLAGRKQPYFI